MNAKQSKRGKALLAALVFAALSVALPIPAPAYTPGDLPVPVDDYAVGFVGEFFTNLQSGATNLYDNDMRSKTGASLEKLEVTEKPLYISYMVDENGTFAFNCDSMKTGSLQYKVRDADGNWSATSATVTIQTVPRNVPIPRDDLIVMEAGSYISILDGGNASLLANDTSTHSSSGSHPAVEAQLVSGAAHGTAIVISDGTFEFSNDGTAGIDSFQYKAMAANGEWSHNDATVRVYVTPRAPVAAPSQIFAQGATVADLAATTDAGSSPQWYDSNMNQLEPTALLADGETYYAKAVTDTYPVLESGPSGPVRADVYPPLTVLDVGVPANGIYTTGQTLAFTVRYGGAVTVTGHPRIPLRLGGNTFYANYASGSGTDSLTFTYTVQPGLYEPSLENKLGPEIDLNGGGLQTRQGLDNVERSLPNIAGLAGVSIDSRSSAKDILSFTLPSQLSSSINGTDIFVAMPAGAPLTSLAPQITLSPDATVAPLSGAAQDFSAPVQYTVTAQDGSQKTYRATVTSGPAVLGVAVSPKTASVEKGKTLQFTAAVAATGGAPATVSWTVNSTLSSIDANGVLTVGANETASTLTVTATSTADASKSDTATVTIAGPAGPDGSTGATSPQTGDGASASLYIALALAAGGGGAGALVYRRRRARSC